MFTLDCGAITGFNTQVSIVPAAETPDTGGNVLVLNGTIPLPLRWLSESQLSISGLGSARVYKQESQVAKVAVIYAK